GRSRNRACRRGGPGTGVFACSAGAGGFALGAAEEREAWNSLWRPEFRHARRPLANARLPWRGGAFPRFGGVRPPRAPPGKNPGAGRRGTITSGSRDGTTGTLAPPLRRQEARMSFGHAWVLLFVWLPVLWVWWEWKESARRLALCFKAAGLAAVVIALAEPR